MGINMKFKSFSVFKVVFPVALIMATLASAKQNPMVFKTVMIIKPSTDVTINGKANFDNIRLVEVTK